MFRRCRRLNNLLSEHEIFQRIVFLENNYNIFLREEKLFSILQYLGEQALIIKILGRP